MTTTKQLPPATDDEVFAFLKNADTLMRFKRCPAWAADAVGQLGIMLPHWVADDGTTPRTADTWDVPTVKRQRKKRTAV
jgi:hypothetical protein